MTQRSVSHTSFVIDREFSASPPQVFRAWSDADAKRRWSNCHSDQATTDYRLDFRLGGGEFHRIVMPDGVVNLIQKHFLDIVPDARIVFSYYIQAAERRLSVSLVTVEFEPSRKGARMIYTEQIGFLDGHENREQLIRGTNEGMDRLDLELRTVSSIQQA